MVGSASYILLRKKIEKRRRKCSTKFGSGANILFKKNFFYINKFNILSENISASNYFVNCWIWPKKLVNFVIFHQMLWHNVRFEMLHTIMALCNVIDCWQVQQGHIYVLVSSRRCSSFVNKEYIRKMTIWCQIYPIYQSTSLTVG